VVTVPAIEWLRLPPAVLVSAPETTSLKLFRHGSVVLKL
jgi:hypothetical protein